MRNRCETAWRSSTLRCIVAFKSPRCFCGTRNVAAVGRLDVQEGVQGLSEPRLPPTSAIGARNSCKTFHRPISFNMSFPIFDTLPIYVPRYAICPIIPSWSFEKEVALHDFLPCLLAAALGDVLRARIALAQHDGHELRHVGTQRMARAHQPVAVVAQGLRHGRPRGAQDPPGGTLCRGARRLCLAARAMPECARPPASKLSSAATSVSTADHSQLPRTASTSLFQRPERSSR